MHAYRSEVVVTESADVASTMVGGVRTGRKPHTLTEHAHEYAAGGNRNTTARVRAPRNKVSGHGCIFYDNIVFHII